MDITKETIYFRTFMEKELKTPVADTLKTHFS